MCCNVVTPPPLCFDYLCYSTTALFRLFVLLRHRFVSIICVTPPPLCFDYLCYSATALFRLFVLLRHRFISIICVTPPPLCFDYLCYSTTALFRLFVLLRHRFGYDYSFTQFVNMVFLNKRRTHQIYYVSLRHPF